MKPPRGVDELLKAGLPAVVVARGGSMWPAVRAGDRLTIEPGRTPRVADLVAYRRDGLLVIHRVRAVAADGIRVRGDAAGVDEPVLAPGDVLGVVTSHRTHDGLHVDHGGGLARVVDRVAGALQPVSRVPLGWLRRVVSRLRGGSVAAESGESGVDGVVGEEQVEEPTRR